MMKSYNPTEFRRQYLCEPEPTKPTALDIWYEEALKFVEDHYDKNNISIEKSPHDKELHITISRKDTVLLSYFMPVNDIRNEDIIPDAHECFRAYVRRFFPKILQSMYNTLLLGGSLK
jgi:hypothetical protein